MVMLVASVLLTFLISLTWPAWAAEVVADDAVSSILPGTFRLRNSRYTDQYASVGQLGPLETTNSSDPASKFQIRLLPKIGQNIRTVIMLVPEGQLDRAVIFERPSFFIYTNLAKIDGLQDTYSERLGLHLFKPPEKGKLSDVSLVMISAPSYHDSYLTLVYDEQRETWRIDGNAVAGEDPGASAYWYITPALPEEIVKGLSHPKLTKTCREMKKIFTKYDDTVTKQNELIHDTCLPADITPGHDTDEL